MEEFIITVWSLTVCVLLKLMTEALWLLVHLKFSLNFIIQLSLWPWINKLQVSYHEFILHLRQIEPGKLPFFSFTISSKHTIKSKFKALFFNSQLCLLKTDCGDKVRTDQLITHSNAHTHIQMLFLCILKSTLRTCITQWAGKKCLFTDADKWQKMLLQWLKA